MRLTPSRAKRTVPSKGISLIVSRHEARADLSESAHLLGSSVAWEAKVALFLAGRTGEQARDVNATFAMPLQFVAWHLPFDQRHLFVSLVLSPSADYPDRERRRSAMSAAPAQAATRSLLALTAADLMTTPVMTIPEEMSLSEAARLLSRTHVSGAPVVDAQGRCVGVLSSSDFVTWAGTAEEATTSTTTISFIAPWGELISINDSGDHEIRRYMTAKPITVEPTTLIGELAQQMVAAHIHRVLVVIDQRRPCGTDVLAAVARAGNRASPKG
jgi:CBS domain-containing protein